MSDAAAAAAAECVIAIYCVLCVGVDSTRCWGFDRLISHAVTLNSELWGS